MDGIDAAAVGKKIVQMTDHGGSESEVMKFYAESAEMYDQGQIGLGCSSPEFVAELASRKYTNRDVALLDVAAGTGRVGEYLKAYGFGHVDALDGSKEMLEVARKKNVYRNIFYCMIGGQRTIPVLDNQYDGITISGGIYPYHLETDCFDELIRVTKTGGFIIISFLHKSLTSDIEDAIKLHQRLGGWKLEEKTIVQKYISSQQGICFILKVVKDDIYY